LQVAEQSALREHRGSMVSARKQRSSASRSPAEQPNQKLNRELPLFWSVSGRREAR
jgi:hypothetical protein